MSNLARDDIAALAREAGFSGKDVDIAAAVALAESGGNPRAYNGKGLDRSYGLWQINMYGDMGPDRRKRFNLSSNDALYDPKTNARVAFGIYQGSGWKAWTTYTRGTYKKHMTGAAEEDTPRIDPNSESGPMFGIAYAIDSFAKTIFNGLASIGAVAVAIVLLVLGFVILARNPVASLAPGGIGKVAKLVKKVEG